MGDALSGCQSLVGFARSGNASEAHYGMRKSYPGLAGI